MSVRLKSKKLTASTTSIGRPKNSSSTSTSGATCNHDARSPLLSSAAASARAGAEKRVRRLVYAWPCRHDCDGQDETNSFQRRVR